MDTAKRDRRWIKRTLWILAAAGLAAAAVFGASRALEGRSIDAEAAFVAQVQSGTFDVVVVADGVIRPQVEEVVATRVAGTVTHVHAQSGQVVEAGAPLIVLENDEVEDAYSRAVLEHRVAIANAAADEIAAENRIRDIEASVARTRLALAKQELFLSAQDALPELSVSKMTYEMRKLDASNLAEVLAIERARLARYRTLAASLAAAREAKRLKAENLLSAAQKQRDSLVVVAPIGGTVSLSQNIVVGQRVGRGQSVGRVVGTQGYFAELEVPEYWAGAVALSNPATVDTWQGELEGRVVAIDADVDDGRVSVRVDLGQLEEALLPGLAVEGRIVTASIDDAVFVRKPVDAREDGTQRVYRFDAETQSYVASDVIFGRASATEIQVLSGLAPGDRIIVSDVGQAAAAGDAITLN